MGQNLIAHRAGFLASRRSLQKFLKSPETLLWCLGVENMGPGRNHFQVQGVPRNMTVGEYFKMSSSIFFKLFETKGNNNKHYIAVLL